MCNGDLSDTEDEIDTSCLTSLMESHHTDCMNQDHDDTPCDEDEGGDEDDVMSDNGQSRGWEGRKEKHNISERKETGPTQEPMSENCEVFEEEGMGCLNEEEMEIDDNTSVKESSGVDMTEVLEHEVNGGETEGVKQDVVEEGEEDMTTAEDNGIGESKDGGANAEESREDSKSIEVNDIKKEIKVGKEHQEREVMEEPKLKEENERNIKQRNNEEVNGNIKEEKIEMNETLNEQIKQEIKSEDGSEEDEPEIEVTHDLYLYKALYNKCNVDKYTHNGGKILFLFLSYRILTLMTLSCWLIV